MKRLVIVSAVITATACYNPVQWEGRVYSSKTPQSDFIPIGVFATAEQCQAAGTALTRQMRLGQNGDASERYSQGKTVCTMAKG